jgi:hypothetical protein
MSTESVTAPGNRVTLLRMGVGKEEVVLPEGATLADLVRLAHVRVEHQEIFIDGRTLLECLALQPNMIVSVVPRRSNAGNMGDWRGAIGDFKDDPEFEAMMRQVMAEREAEKERP